MLYAAVTTARQGLSALFVEGGLPTVAQSQTSSLMAPEKGDAEPSLLVMFHRNVFLVVAEDAEGSRPTLGPTRTRGFRQVRTAL